MFQLDPILEIGLKIFNLQLDLIHSRIASLTFYFMQYMSLSQLDLTEMISIIFVHRLILSNISPHFSDACNYLEIEKTLGRRVRSPMKPNIFQESLI